jgi:hypothetical protein
MANLLEAVIPRILSGGMVAFRENSVMSLLVNRNFDSDARQKGSSVDVPIPSTMGEARDVIPSKLAPDTADLSPQFIPIKLDQWKYQAFRLTDKEIYEIMNGYQNLQVAEAAKSLANSVDKYLLSLYKGVYGIAGLAGNTPFQENTGTPAVYKGMGAGRDARKVLNRQLTPVSDRRILLDVESEANATALPEFLNADKAGTDVTIKEGIIGRKLGFDWFMSQNVLTHETGAAGTITTTGASNLKGVKVLTVTGASAAPIEGDVFTIAGDPYPYVVGKDATTTSWPITPALRQDAPAASAITVVGDHVVNMAFHRDAFALAVRPLNDVIPAGSMIETFTDDMTKITMRLEVTRENKQTLFTFDILFGAAVIRPEGACRILG